MRWVAVAGVLVGLAACTSGATSRPAAVTSPPSSRPVATTHASVAPRVLAPSPSPSPASTTPPPNACAHNPSTKRVLVSLRAQHLWLCAHTAIAYSTPITSGVVGQYTSTPTGSFRIQGVNRNTSLTLIDGSSYAVKYWIPFDAPLFGFHDSSWQDFPYGSPKYKTHGSHGCVHMPIAAIAFLAHWAPVGTPVRIRA